MPQATLQFINQQKKVIDPYLENLVIDQRQKYQHHPAADEIFTYLQEFLLKGKTIRGALFMEVVKSFTGKSNSEMVEYLPVAAAIEIIHSALLIQDDLMDQDNYRRGFQALHHQLRKKAVDDNLPNPELYTTSALMCATDICFFLAFGEISKLKSPHFTSLVEFLTQEYIHVGFAQWEDVRLGQTTMPNELEEIEQIYRYKTARYTFAMPIALAAMIAQVSDKEREKLETACEDLGRVFQITDDYLNLFGDESVTGKSIGSDISEDKKTIMFFLLKKALSNSTNSQHRNILSYFGQNEISFNQLKEVQTAVHELGIKSSIDAIIQRDEVHFMAALKASQTTPAIAEQLRNIFIYVKNRTS